MKHWLKCILFLGTFCSTVELLAIGGEDSLPRYYFNIPLEKIEVRYIQPFHRYSGAMDSMFFSLNKSMDLGRALSKNGQVNVFQYGPQGTACLVRMNGLSPDHTQLSWKGVSLNSLTLGQTDFSLVPAYFFDQLSMGSSKSTENGGYAGFGGNIHLNQFHKESAPLVGFWMEMNSLRNQSSGGEINQRRVYGENKRWYNQLKWIQGDFRNQFTYQWKDLLGARRIEQSNNDVSQQGLLYKTNAELGQYQLSGQYWIVQRNAELPNTMGQEGKYLQEQDDDIHRWQLGLERDTKGESILRNWALNYVGTRDNQQYRVNYQFEGVNGWSENSTLIQQHWFSGLLQYRFRRYWQNVKVNHRMVKVGYNLNTPIHQQIPQLLSESRWLGDRWNFYLLADRQYWGKRSNDQHEATIEWVKGNTNPDLQKYYLRFQMAAFFQQRMPDFNELYWPGSGNPELKQESAKGFRTFAEWMLGPDNDFQSKLSFDIEYNQRWVNDWIQWVPNTNGIWSPVNLSYVVAQSINGNVKVNSPVFQSVLKTRVYGQMNEVTLQNDLNNADAVGKTQLPYTPRWKWGMECMWMHKTNFFVQMNYKWTSLRYTDESNEISSSLPDYSLLDCSLGRYSSRSGLQWSVGVENLANVQYQEVRSYALPGRVFKCQINIQIK